MQKKPYLLLALCAAISLSMADGAHASLISAPNVAIVTDAAIATDAAHFATPEPTEHASILTSFWDNTPRAPQIYLDVQSLIIKTGEDANLKFKVESATFGVFNFAGSMAPAYGANFRFALSSNPSSNVDPNFSLGSPLTTPAFGL